MIRVYISVLVFLFFFFLFFFLSFDFSATLRLNRRVSIKNEKEDRKSLLKIPMG